MNRPNGKRALQWTAILMLAAVVLLIAGVLATMEPGQAQHVRHWLAAHRIAWLVWRLLLYAAIVFWLAPRLAIRALGPATGGDDEKDRRQAAIEALQWRLMVLAIALELLVMQHGLAWLMDLLTA